MLHEEIIDPEVVPEACQLTSSSCSIHVGACRRFQWLHRNMPKDRREFPSTPLGDIKWIFQGFDDYFLLANMQPDCNKGTTYQGLLKCLPVSTCQVHLFIPRGCQWPMLVLEILLDLAQSIKKTVVANQSHCWRVVSLQSTRSVPDTRDSGSQHAAVIYLYMWCSTGLMVDGTWSPCLILVDRQHHYHCYHLL